MPTNRVSHSTRSWYLMSVIAVIGASAILYMLIYGALYCFFLVAQSVIGIAVGTFGHTIQIRKLSPGAVIKNRARVKAGFFSGLVSVLFGFLSACFFVKWIFVPQCTNDGDLYLIFVVPVYAAFSGVVGILFGAGFGQTSCKQR